MDRCHVVILPMFVLASCLFVYYPGWWRASKGVDGEACGMCVLACPRWQRLSDDEDQTINRR